MKISVRMLVLVGTLVLASTIALSAPLPATGGLSIDFRTDAWAGADGVDTFTVNYATAGDVTAATFLGNTVLFRADAVDGLGIQDPNSADEADEIDGGEELSITFQKNIFITGFGITDLFGPPDGSDNTYGEQGRVDFFRDGVFLFYVLFEGVNSTQANGEQLVVLSRPLEIDRAAFFRGNLNANNEFAVAGFNLAAVPDTGEQIPEPGTISMLAVGFGCLALAWRRRKISNS